MTDAQRTMLFSLFSRCARGLGPIARERKREQITIEVFGEPRSWAAFGDREVDRMKPALQALVRALELAPRIESEAYRTHDAAQAAHVPAVRPGKRERAKPEPRPWASRYEARTAANDPGERRRLIYWIGRLFDTGYIRSLARGLDDTADWESLPIPDLLALKDTLKNRLGKWLTRHKETYDFGFSITSRNPRSTTGLLTNDEVIAELLARALRVDIREPHEKFHEEPSTEEVEAPF
jgi:hypothetical protein